MKSPITVLGFLLISSQAFAGVLGGGGADLLRPHLAPAPASDCVSFAGRWEGFCQKEGQAAEAETAEIKQVGCQYLVADGQFAAIGGTASQGHVIPQDGGDLSLAASTNLTWNNEKTAIVFTTQAAIYKTGLGLLGKDTIRGFVGIHEGKLVSYSKGNDSETRCVLSPAAN